MQCQRRLQISRLKNLGNVLQQTGVVFRLAPPDGGLLDVINLILSPVVVVGKEMGHVSHEEEFEVIRAMKTVHGGIGHLTLKE